MVACEVEHTVAPSALLACFGNDEPAAGTADDHIAAARRAATKEGAVGNGSTTSALAHPAQVVIPPFAPTAARARARAAGHDLRRWLGPKSVRRAVSGGRHKKTPHTGFQPHPKSQPAG